MDEEGTWMNISWIHWWMNISRLSPYTFTFRNICGFFGLWGKIIGWMKRALEMNITQIYKWMDEEGT
jgi:hypothetical protein